MHSMKNFRDLLRKIKNKLMRHVKLKFFSTTYELHSEDELNSCIVREVFESGFVSVTFAPVSNISKGGSIELSYPSCKIYCFPAATQQNKSDIIIYNKKVFFPKLNRLSSEKEIFCDSNLLGFSKTSVVVLNPSNTINVGNAFSLLGVHSSHWAHFLVEFLPKLVFSKYELLGLESIVISSECDDHIKQLLQANIPASVSIISVKPGASVRFNNLFYCSYVSYLCNNSSYTSIADIVIPASTRVAVLEGLSNFSNSIVQSVSEINFGNKIFLGHKAKRSATNSIEVEQFFQNKGFQIVYPHLLTLKEKIICFELATSVCGFSSSAFTNLLFSKSVVNVLALTNYNRCFDTYVSQFGSLITNINFLHFVCSSVDKNDINSVYTVDISKLEIFLESSNFFR